jgi:Tol biopolymer transport system component
MKTNFPILALVAIFTFFGCSNSSESRFPVLKGAYLGQVEPQEIAQVFAPNIISTGMYERDLAVSPDGTEIFYSLFMGDWNTIMVTKQVKGVWLEPVVADFARDTNFFFAEPVFSADGSQVYYLSTQPRVSETPKPGWTNQNIWYSQKQDDGSWSQGKPLSDIINAEEEFYPSLTSNGTLYFCRTNKETGNSQILRSKLIDGNYAEPEILPAPVNTTGTHFNAFISPDDSYLVGCVVGRDVANPRKSTYMLFFHNQDDSWSEGIDLTKELNLPAPSAISISLSPDGKYLFFASTFKSIAFKQSIPDWSQSKMAQRRSAYGNGNSDIYWIRFDEIVKELRN